MTTRPWRIVSVAAGVGIAALVATGWLAPVFAAAGYADSVGAYLLLETVCRQDAAHSWSYHGVTAALCFRCSGIGLVAAVALVRPDRLFGRR